MNRPPKKIVFYCQYVLGVGHLFRSLEIAKSLSPLKVVLITGGPPAPAPWPENVTEARQPALRMDDKFRRLIPEAKGQWVAQVMARRAERLMALLEEHRPDLFLVEYFPFGRRLFKSELQPALKALRAGRFGRALVVCSLRDILVERFDEEAYEKKAVARANRFFDGLLIHADENVSTLDETFKRAAEIKIPTHYTGYVGPAPEPGLREKQRARLGLAERDRLVVASAGGGGVGADLLARVIEAFRNLAGSGFRLHVFSGPLTPEDQYHRLEAAAQGQDSVHLQRFSQNFLGFLCAADLSLSLAGYNTVVNLLAAKTPALIWPFGQNQEQRLRAGKLARLDLARVLEDDDLEPARLAELMDRLLREPVKIPPRAIDLNGAARTAELLRDWLNEGRAR